MFLTHVRCVGLWVFFFFWLLGRMPEITITYPADKDKGQGQVDIGLEVKL